MKTASIGEKIKEIRLENGLSQAKFGEILHVSQDTISLWEKGKALPNTEYVILICKTFDISADYLLGIKE
ncbi:MAG: helix-turn-helix transcriptional regulator [Clostridia bacterium]|nr:helix-turn-helix transcriptional regulator [Clostridia bacterium]